MRRTVFRTLVVSLALFAFRPALGEPPKADPNRARIERLGKVFIEAFNRGDVAAVAAMYTEDAIAFPPDGAIVKGRPAIQALWQSFRDTGATSVEFTVLDVETSGNLSVETGTALLHVQPSGQAEVTVQVKYVVVWKKQKDGSWKLFRDIWNGMPSPPTP